MSAYRNSRPRSRSPGTERRRRREEPSYNTPSVGHYSRRRIDESPSRDREESRSEVIHETPREQKSRNHEVLRVEIVKHINESIDALEQKWQEKLQVISRDAQSIEHDYRIKLVGQVVHTKNAMENACETLGQRTTLVEDRILASEFQLAELKGGVNTLLESSNRIKSLGGAIEDVRPALDNLRHRVGEAEDSIAKFMGPTLSRIQTSLEAIDKDKSARDPSLLIEEALRTINPKFDLLGARIESEHDERLRLVLAVRDLRSDVGARDQKVAKQLADSEACMDTLRRTQSALLQSSEGRMTEIKAFTDAHRRKLQDLQDEQHERVDRRLAEMEREIAHARPKTERLTTDLTELNRKVVAIGSDLGGKFESLLSRHTALAESTRSGDDLRASSVQKLLGEAVDRAMERVKHAWIVELQEQKLKERAGAVAATGEDLRRLEEKLLDRVFVLQNECQTMVRDSSRQVTREVLTKLPTSRVDEADFAALKATITGLTTQLAAQQKQIADLTSALSPRVDGLADSLREVTREAERERQLRTESERRGQEELSRALQNTREMVANERAAFLDRVERAREMQQHAIELREHALAAERERSEREESARREDLAREVASREKEREAREREKEEKRQHELEQLSKTQERHERALTDLGQLSITAQGVSSLRTSLHETTTAMAALEVRHEEAKRASFAQLAKLAEDVGTHRQETAATLAALTQAAADTKNRLLAVDSVLTGASEPLSAVAIIAPPLPLTPTKSREANSQLRGGSPKRKTDLAMSPLSPNTPDSPFQGVQDDLTRSLSATSSMLEMIAVEKKSGPLVARLEACERAVSENAQASLLLTRIQQEFSKQLVSLQQSHTQTTAELSQTKHLAVSRNAVPPQPSVRPEKAGRRNSQNAIRVEDSRREGEEKGVVAASSVEGSVEVVPRDSGGGVQSTFDVAALGRLERKMEEAVKNFCTHEQLDLVVAEVAKNHRTQTDIDRRLGVLAEETKAAYGKLVRERERELAEFRDELRAMQKTVRERDQERRSAGQEKASVTDDALARLLREYRKLSDASEEAKETLVALKDRQAELKQDVAADYKVIKSELHRYVAEFKSDITELKKATHDIGEENETFQTMWKSTKAELFKDGNDNRRALDLLEQALAATRSELSRDLKAAREHSLEAKRIAEGLHKQLEDSAARVSDLELLTVSIEDQQEKYFRTTSGRLGTLDTLSDALAKLTKQVDLKLDETEERLERMLARYVSEKETASSAPAYLPGRDHVVARVTRVGGGFSVVSAPTKETRDRRTSPAREKKGGEGSGRERGLSPFRTGTFPEKFEDLSVNRVEMLYKRVEELGRKMTEVETVLASTLMRDDLAELVNAIDKVNLDLQTRPTHSEINSISAFAHEQALRLDALEQLEVPRWQQFEAVEQKLLNLQARVGASSNSR